MVWRMSRVCGTFEQVSILSESFTNDVAQDITENDTEVRLELSLSHHGKAFNDYHILSVHKFYCKLRTIPEI